MNLSKVSEMGMNKNTQGKATLLCEHGGKEEDEDYPTSVVHLISTMRCVMQQMQSSTHVFSFPPYF